MHLSPLLLVWLFGAGSLLGLALSLAATWLWRAAHGPTRLPIRYWAIYIAAGAVVPVGLFVRPGC